MEQKKIKYKRSYHRVIMLGIILLLMIAAAMAYAFTRYSTTKNTLGQAGNEKTTIMVMGVDSRADDVGRSDTLMVFTVDEKKDDVSVLSIPRDTRVKIDGHNYDKINHAYAYGGHQLTQKAVEDLLNVPMNYYVLINIQSFAKIIDAIGGVDIDVEKRMYYDDPWDDNGGLHIDLYPGMQHMDGKKAIEYVRFRDGEGDIGRIARQQHFIKAVLAKVLTPAVLPKIPEIIKEVSSTVKTNLSFTDMLKFARLLPGMKDGGVTSSMLPGKPAYIDDVSYWLPDIEELRRNMAETMDVVMTSQMEADAQQTAEEYNKSLPDGLKLLSKGPEEKVNNSDAVENNTEKKDSPMKPEDITVMVINSSGINGAGAAVAEQLQRKGFKISSVETGRTSSNQQTKIMTNDNAVNLFYGMSFPCVIMTGSGTGQAVVNIGRDYRR
ncbi:LCP family protein [Pectinatus frisingensis]|uniref:LCP family protein n=1 Tax=Pectinatus frisingensis TaxID=865 RepID=UPI001E5A5B10|nr:LCP family protein [Pectinatus frisingensis]